MMLMLILLGLGFVESAQQQQQQQAIGESGGEESEDEWNYIKVDDKKTSDGLAAVEEASETIKELPFEKEESSIADTQPSGFEINVSIARLS